MRMLFAGFACIIICSCGKNTPTDKVFKNLTVSPKVGVLADGQSFVNVSVELFDKSTSDRRTVVFSTTSGVFTTSGNSKYTAKAEYENGILVAKGRIKVSTEPAKMKISVQPEFDSPIREYSLSDSLTTLLSTPASLQLESSSFGIATNHLNEVIITGRLKNSAGQYVSKGYKVEFVDSVGAARGMGQFRELHDETGDSSKVSCYYSAFAHPIGTPVRIRAKLINGNQTTPITDVITLTINQ